MSSIKETRIDEKVRKTKTGKSLDLDDMLSIVISIQQDFNLPKRALRACSTSMRG
jgi:hypothetical protein